MSPFCFIKTLSGVTSVLLSAFVICKQKFVVSCNKIIKIGTRDGSQKVLLNEICSTMEKKKKSEVFELFLTLDSTGDKKRLFIIFIKITGITWTLAWWDKRSFKLKKENRKIYSLNVRKLRK